MKQTVAGVSRTVFGLIIIIFAAIAEWKVVESIINSDVTNTVSRLVFMALIIAGIVLLCFGLRLAISNNFWNRLGK